MPSLIIFRHSRGPGYYFEDWDAESVTEHDRYPGTDVVNGDTYGFVYITDKEPNEIRHIVLEPMWAAEDNSADGGDVGDYDQLGARRMRCDGSKIAGPANKWQNWRPYGSNQNIEVTWAQALLFIEDKLA